MIIFFQGNVFENVCKLAAISFKCLCINPEGAETGIFQNSLINTMAADVLGLCVITEVISDHVSDSET